MTEPQLGDSDREVYRREQFHARVCATWTHLSETHRAVRLYALVDARGLPELRSALERLDSISFASLWDGTDLSAFKDIAPLLIEVDLGAADTDIPHHLLERLRRFSDDGFMVTWIWAPHELAPLAAHFRAHCEYTLADRRAFYLHFYDNRILGRLRLTWTAEEWTRFASVALEIWYRNRSGEDESWHADTVSQPISNVSLALTDEQHLALFSLGYADKVAMELTEVHGPLLEHLSSGDLVQTVRTQIERATRYGIRDERDMLGYVAKGLLGSPNFDEHPLIQKGLESARHGDVPLAEVLSQVDEILAGDYAGRRAT
ncbi:MAG: DUF4123 domain-containing protein [Pararobbsia sp.]